MFVQLDPAPFTVTVPLAVDGVARARPPQPMEQVPLVTDRAGGRHADVHDARIVVADVDETLRRPTAEPPHPGLPCRSNHRYGPQVTGVLRSTCCRW